MMAEDARYLKKRIKGGHVDVHPTEKALVVKYEVEATILGEMGEHMLGDKKECQKVIRLNSLNANTNISALAREVVERCKLIHPSKLAEVEQLLYYLQSRRDTSRISSASSSDRSPRQAVTGSIKEPSALDDGAEMTETAQIMDIDKYIELLYEDIPEKTRGTALILQLARNPDNLEEFLQNVTLLGALARVLREDWKKSMEVAFNIVYVFFCFSTFSQFHHVIAHFKIGALCMQVIEHEIKRHGVWKDELEIKKFDAENNSRARSDYEKSLQKYQALVKKQEQLLRMCFYLLLNLSEDAKVEFKMTKKNIVLPLMKCLDRDNDDLIMLVLTFLKKLSIYIENKTVMVHNHIIEECVRFVSHKNEDIVHMSLRLIKNLAFDRDVRDKLVKLGYLQKLVNLMNGNNHGTLCTEILYLISMDDKYKALFTYTDCVPIMMKMMLEYGGKHVRPEVAALAVNLSINKRNAEMMCEGSGLKLLMKRAFKYKDQLLMKVIRNISTHSDTTKAMFIDYVSDLANALVKCPSDEFVIEVVGILGNLTIPDLNYELLLSEYQLVTWVQNRLTPGMAGDDLMLEVVIFIGTVSIDENAASLILRSGVLAQLIELLNDRQEDDEIVCQIVYVFYRLTFHEATRNYIIKETQVPAYLIDLMHDKNKQVRKVCTNTLDIIAESDSVWQERVQVEKFRWYNQQWLDMVESQQLGVGGVGPPGTRPRTGTAMGTHSPDPNATTTGSDDQLLRYNNYIHDTDALDRPSDLYSEDGYDSAVLLSGDDSLSPDLMLDAGGTGSDCNGGSSEDRPGGATHRPGHHPRTDLDDVSATATAHLTLPSAVTAAAAGGAGDSRAVTAATALSHYAELDSALNELLACVPPCFVYTDSA